MDPALEQANTELNEAAEPLGGQPHAAEEAPEMATAEMALVKKFDNENRIPEIWKPWYEQIKDAKDYVNASITEKKDPLQVRVNHVLRLQYVRLAQLYFRRPEVDVRKAKRLEKEPADIMEMASKQERDKVLSDFARTALILGEKLCELARLDDIVEGAIQDASTAGWAWVMAVWQEDITRDALGQYRQNDFTDTVAKLERLKADFAANKFTEADAEYKEMRDAEETMRVMVMAEQQSMMATQTARATGQTPMTAIGTPEIPRWSSVAFEPIDADDIRIGWAVKKPEMWWTAPFISYRVWMTDEQIKERFGVTDEYFMGSTIGKMAGFAPGGNTAPANEDASEPDAGKKGGLRAVWCRMDREAGRFYTWVQGCHTFLRNEIPVGTTSLWYPIRPLFWNRVSGRPTPVPDIILWKDLQDEINRLRTHDRQARRAAYNSYLTKRGLLNPQEKAYLESCPPEGVVEVESPDEVAKNFMVVPKGGYKPELYSTGSARQDLETMAAVPAAAMGATGTSNFATETAVANEQMGLSASRMQVKVENFYSELMLMAIEMANEFMAEENVVALVGDGAVWPKLDRAALWRQFSLEVKTGSAAKKDKKQLLDFLTQAAGVLGSLGIPVNPVEILRMLIDALDLRIEPEELLMVPNPAAAPPAGPGGPPGAPSGQPGTPPGGDSPGGPPGQAPQDQGPIGAEQNPEGMAPSGPRTPQQTYTGPAQTK